MKTPFAVVGLFGLVVAFTLVISGVYQRRLARDLYPAYSSLRSDPVGVRALHDAVAALPGWHVARWLQPLAELPAKPERTVLILGLHGAPEDLGLTVEEAQALHAAAAHGSRVVLAFAPRPSSRKEEGPAADRPPESPPDKTSAEAPEQAPPLTAPDVLRFNLVEIGVPEGAARLARRVAGEELFPAQLPWSGELGLDLAAAPDWEVSYRRADHPVIATRPVGQGSLVVLAETHLLTNEALQRSREAELLAWLLGDVGQVVWVESHLGVQSNPGVAALARRYGLEPAFALLLLLGLLWTWRQSAPLLPPIAPHPTVALAYSPTAGLEALLRRSLRPHEFLPACLDEWKRTATPAEQARLSASLPAPASPVEHYNLLVRAVGRSARARPRLP